MAAGQQPVSDTPTPIAPGYYDKNAVLVNIGHCYVFVGQGSDVTPDNGYPLAPGQRESFDASQGLCVVRRSATTLSGQPFAAVSWSTT